MAGERLDLESSPHPDDDGDRWWQRGSNFTQHLIYRLWERDIAGAEVLPLHWSGMNSDFDRLKAILTNCAKLGPATQNREKLANFKAHLEGRIGFVYSINAAKGTKLKEIFATIKW